MTVDHFAGHTVARLAIVAAMVAAFAGAASPGLSRPAAEPSGNASAAAASLDRMAEAKKKPEVTITIPTHPVEYVERCVTKWTVKQVCRLVKYTVGQMTKTKQECTRQRIPVKTCQKIKVIKKPPSQPPKAQPK